jgi:ABC-type bacteriocin/lantibiotic exporter with double-glycine peptidase domain
VCSKGVTLVLLAAFFLQVPFFPDHTDQCGPSVVASVLSFWGTSVTPAELRQEVYIDHLKGSLSIDLLLAAQKRGYKAHIYSGSMQDLKSEIGEGHPVIAFLNRGFTLLPVGHYVVITGYDDVRQGLMIHSGMNKNKFISYKRFSGFWDKTQNSTLLILPPVKDNESDHAGT